MELKTNKEIGKEIGVSSRQISKSRRRGWIWRNGKKEKYTAPPAVFKATLTKEKHKMSIKAKIKQQLKEEREKNNG